MNQEKKSSKRWIVAVILILAIIAIAAFFAIRAGQEPNLTDRIEGTYATNATDDFEGDGLYLVLDNEGTFTYYKQFKILDKGKYVKGDYEDIFTLKGTKGAIDGQIILKDKAVYLQPVGEKEFIRLKKFSEDPTYINVNHSE